MMLTSTMVSIFTVTAVAATTALIMGGTGNPLSTEKDTVPFIQDYMGMAVNNYIGPSSTATPSTGIPKGPYNAVAVITPEEWAPQTGDLTLDQSIAEGARTLTTASKRPTACTTPTSGRRHQPLLTASWSSAIRRAPRSVHSRSVGWQPNTPTAAAPSLVQVHRRRQPPERRVLGAWAGGLHDPERPYFGGATFSGATPSKLNTRPSTSRSSTTSGQMSLESAQSAGRRRLVFELRALQLQGRQPRRPGNHQSGSVRRHHYYMIPRRFSRCSRR